MSNLKYHYLSKVEDDYCIFLTPPPPPKKKEEERLITINHQKLKFGTNCLRWQTNLLEIIVGPGTVGNQAEVPFSLHFQWVLPVPRWCPKLDRLTKSL